MQSCHYPRLAYRVQWYKLLFSATAGSIESLILKELLFLSKCKNHRETWWYLVYAISSSAVRILWEKILTPSSWQLLSILNLTVVFQYGFEPPSTEKTLGILVVVCETHVHISFHLQHNQDYKLHTTMTPTQNSIVVLGYSWGFYTLPISSQLRSI
jgi:hypothetical protein